ncbi:hypothetical protein PIB30_074607 [Stylosanthes scabra]|uniref:Ubiquitin-like protease family profile domain-containing protein n=1 Tax=Stylosanthes scabra TaxID=79078 RepID=A0ABU6UQU5_9FABA|nr:hypothetical protein [Stylosanthes scabra]
MNWARHVCSFLLDGIAEMRRKNSKGVEGCVFDMLIIYLHETHFGEYSEDDEARPSWISYWRGDRLKERLKLEKKDSTLAENADAAVDPPSQGVAAIDDVLVTPQECEIEVVEATSAEEDTHLVVETNVEKGDIAEKESVIEVVEATSAEENTHLVVETNVEKGDIAEKESVIEVVEATSAEEELIRRELSESIANLVVETNVEKGDIAENESVIEQLTHKYWESNREPKENVENDKEVHEEINRNIMMIAKMAVAQGDMGLLPSFDLDIDFGSQSQSQSQPEKEKEPAQETEKHDQDVQKQKGKEIQQHQGPEIKTPEEAIKKQQCMRKLCYKWATKPEGNNEYQHLFRFKTGKQYETMRYHFTSMAEEAEMDLAHNILEKYGPDYIDAKTGLPYKIETMTNLDTLDYIDENKINHLLLFDCGVYVLKYMDIVNPSLLEKKNFTVPVWAEDELQRFREEFVERILYDGDNYYKHQAIRASNATARHPRPSTALQRPSTQLQSTDLESGKLE